MMSFCIMFVVRIIASRPYYIQLIQIITIGDNIISILFYLQPPLARAMQIVQKNRINH